jgi:hypothetical protein
MALVMLPICLFIKILTPATNSIAHIITAEFKKLFAVKYAIKLPAKTDPAYIGGNAPISATFKEDCIPESVEFAIIKDRNIIVNISAVVPKYLYLEWLAVSIFIS